MPGKIILDKVDLTLAPNAPVKTYIVAFDLDGILKKKDQSGNITPIGGGSSSIVWANAIYVTKNPSLTPAVGDKSKPFDLVDAMAISQSGQTVVIMQGDYTFNGNLAKNGVNIVSIGKVKITKSSGSGPMMNIDSTFTEDFSMDGDFDLRCDIAQPVISITSNSISVRAKFRTARSLGRIGGTAGSSSCINIFNQSGYIKIDGDIIVADDQSGLFVTNVGRITHTGNIICEDSLATGAFCVNVDNGIDVELNIIGFMVGGSNCTGAYLYSVKSFNLYGNMYIDTGISIRAYSPGGDIKIFGSLFGRIEADFNGLNANGCCQLIVYGSMSGNVINEGGNIVLNGPLIAGTLINNNSNGRTIMNGEIQGTVDAPFQVSNGILEIYGRLKRSIQNPGIITGPGRVVLYSKWSVNMAGTIADPNQRHIIEVQSGELELTSGCLLENINNTSYANCIKQTGGLVTFNGCMVKATHADALCLQGNISYNVKMINGAVNRDIFVGRSEKFTLTVVTPIVDGNIYSVTIAGGSVATHTAIGGDTATVIRNDISTQLSIHPSISSVANSGSDKILVELISGSHAHSTVRFDIDATHPHHSASTDVVTGTTTPTVGSYIFSTTI